MSYAANLASAKRLLTAKGQAITLTAPPTGTYDPATTSISGSPPTPVSTSGVVLPLSRGLQHMPGSDIQVGDKQLLLPGDIDQPAVGTTASIGAVDYKIVEVNPLNPGGTPILYDCMIRGGQ